MYRRKTFTRKPSRSFGARRGSGLITSTRKANRPRWNVGNFFFYNEVLQNYSDSAPFANIWSQLAQNSIFQTSGDTYSGRAARAIDVGGIACTTGYYPANAPTSVLDWDGYDPTLVIQQAFVVDRVAADGSPIAVEWDMSRNTQPIAASAGSGTQSDDMPTRILKRWGSISTFTEESLGGTSTDRWLPQHEVVQNRWSHNLRLKVRLDADHGLYFVQHVRRVGETNTELNIARGAVHYCFGTIYYRIVE